MIGMSSTAAAAHPALRKWLDSAGLGCALVDPAQERGPSPAILAAVEQGSARAGDVIIEAADGAAELTLGENAVWRLRVGSEDGDFGLALAAELVRPGLRPACADPSSVRILDFVQRIAASDASVLVLGETGTGKEGIARYIHACSQRARGGFIAVNCAALPETMLEAILFGHRRGAFTGAAGEGEGLFRAASGGTLLLDEIGEVPLALQAKLLRALQEKEVLPVGATRAEAVDVRVIACANRDLAGEVAAGRFRADLYWRLNVVPVNLQPLRVRRRDIPAIVAAMLLRHWDRRSAFPFPTPAAMERLAAHDWPGNCRELDNVLQRALLLRSGERLEASDLAIDALPQAEPTAGTLGDIARAAEARTIRAALAETGGHRLRAAERLGISERTLRYRLAEMRADAA
ncbi:MAG TPA: sigma 54-interacting transcriptional regulator [Allosphingosinicella sp.]|nr:sigma 54-interacting transcriptional regulator [Allosphingosinicella sp.]